MIGGDADPRVRNGDDKTFLVGDGLQSDRAASGCVLDRVVEQVVEHAAQQAAKRPGTRKVMEKLFSDPQVRKAQGVFVSPFAAQARDLSKFLAEERLDLAGLLQVREGTRTFVS